MVRLWFLVLSIENSKKTKLLTELVSEFVRVTRYKANIQKSIIFLHIINRQLGYKVKNISMYNVKM